MTSAKYACAHGWREYGLMSDERRPAFMGSRPLTSSLIVWTLVGRTSYIIFLHLRPFSLFGESFVVSLEGHRSVHKWTINS